MYKAGIELKQLDTEKVRVTHIENLKPYFGSIEDGYEAAMSGYDQYRIRKIKNYTGDPERWKWMVRMYGSTTTKTLLPPNILKIMSNKRCSCYHYNGIRRNGIG